jgi:hypothetical protein
MTNNIEGTPKNILCPNVIGNDESCLNEMKMNFTT